MCIRDSLSVTAGWFFFPPEWSPGLKIVAGVGLGIGSGVCLYLPRMIATDYDD